MSHKAIKYALFASIGVILLLTLMMVVMNKRYAMNYSPTYQEDEYLQETDTEEVTDADELNEVPPADDAGTPYAGDTEDPEATPIGY